MHLSQHKLWIRKTELALEVKFYLGFHRVTRPWRRTLTNRSGVKYVFPWCPVDRAELLRCRHSRRSPLGMAPHSLPGSLWTVVRRCPRGPREAGHRVEAWLARLSFFCLSSCPCRVSPSCRVSSCALCALSVWQMKVEDNKMGLGLLRGRAGNLV